MTDSAPLAADALDALLADLDGPTVLVLEGGDEAVGARQLRDLPGATWWHAEAHPDEDWSLVHSLVEQADSSGVHVPSLLRRLPLATVDVLAVGAALVELVGGTAPGRPLVISLDAAHETDAASALALLFAFRRLQSEPVLVVVTAPATAPQLAPWRALAGSGAGRILQVPPSETPTSPDGPLAQVSAAAADLAGVAAVLGDRVSLATLASVSGAAGATADGQGALVAELVGSGLLRRHGSTLQWVQPAQRRRVLAGLPGGRVRALHARAAAALPAGAERLGHLAASATAPDEAVAAELAAAILADPPAWPVPVLADALESAGRLTEDGQLRETWLSVAVANMATGGHLERAGKLADRLDATAARATDGSGGSADAAAALGILAMAQGDLAAADTLLTLVVSQGYDGPVAQEARGWLGGLRVVQGRSGEASATGEQAFASASTLNGRISALVALVAGLVIGGEPRAALTAVEREPLPADLLPDHANLLLGRALARIAGDDLTGALEDLAVAEDLGRAGAPLRYLELTAALRSYCCHRLGRQTQALVLARLALSLCADVERLWTLPFVHGFALYAVAAAGPDLGGDAAELAVMARAGADVTGAAFMEVFASAGEAELAMRRGDAEAVVACTDRILDLGVECARPLPGLLHWPLRRAEALIALGRGSEAAALLRDFTDALPADAAGPGRAAALTLLGRASGDGAPALPDSAARAGTAGAWAGLTEQERGVALLAAQGLSNREVGEQLYITSFTVDYHLRKIYRKLGLVRRADLAAALPADAVAGVTAGAPAP